MGRKRGICSCTTAHKAANGKESAHVLNGCTHMVLWPHHGASKNMRRVIGTYAQQPEDLLTLLRKDPAWGRCVTLRLTTPSCAVGARRAMLLNRPEVLEGLARGIHQNIVKSAREGTRVPESDPDPDTAPRGAIAAARRRNRR